ncbi:hypothetical protein, partial [Microbacterium sp. VKM Ac-2923]|uniref:hypothetical protein n=1 Tax=Microbacterium sp. VKM Ac-2923 TaxID=2929476 RepID=UPI001FB1D115
MTATKSGYATTAKTSAGTTVTASTVPVIRIASDIVSSAVWDPATTTVYLIETDVTIKRGATLTLGEKATVKFAPSSNANLTVAGSLVANGTSASPVVFTSLYDDSVGGDTNTDGDDTKPENGSWSGIRVSDGGSVALTQARVLYPRST